MFDAYQVAIRLKLVDQFSGVMGMVVRQLADGHAHADKLQQKLTSITKLMTAGAMTTGAGFGLLMTLKASTNEAVKFEQQLNRLRALNLDVRFGAGTTRGLEQTARDIAERTKGTSVIDALRLITETQSITGDVRHTLELVPLLAKVRYGLETYMTVGGKGSGHGEKGEAQFRDIVKVMEMRGLMRNFSEAQGERLADLFVKNYVASGGQVKPSDFLSMMKTGGIAAKSIGEDYLFALGHIMQEKGGARAGTALMSGYQNAVAGRTTQQVAEQLLHYGLLKPGSIEYGTTGHIKKVRPEALKAAALYQDSPLEFLLQELQPALLKKGVDINDAKRVIPIINQMFSNRTAADQMATLYLERDQIQNYMAQSKNAAGFRQLYEMAGGSATGEQLDLMAKISELEREFGLAALPLLKEALQQAIPLVKELGRWMKENQNGLSMLVKGVAGLGVAMAVSGPLMVLGAAIGGLRVASKLAMTGIGGINGKLKTLGEAGMAFGVGWTVGTALHDAVLEGTKFDHVLRRVVAHLLAFIGFGSKEDLARNDDNENAVDRMLRERPGRAARPETVRPVSFSDDHARRLTINNKIVMPNGHVLANVVTQEQEKRLNRAPTGGNLFDPNMTPMYPGHR